MLKQLSEIYAKLKIRGKITVPFVSLFIISWISGTSFLGLSFAKRLRTSEINATQNLSILVAQSLNKKLEHLRRHARLLANDDALASAINNQDITAIRQEILPLQGILDDDWVAIFNADQKLLAKFSINEISNTEFLIKETVAQVLAGADFSSLVGSNEPSLSLLIGTAPIKDESGIIGGILLGKQLSGSLLSQFATELRVELVALSEETIIAHSFTNLSEQYITAIQAENTNTITIGNQHYFQARVPLEGIGGEQVTLVVLSDRDHFARALLTLWITVIGVALGGTVIAVLLGSWVGRHISQPIKELADTAEEATQEANFDIHIPITTQDEVGTLARTLNQLIEWAGFYTRELETANQTLETKVQERTQVLENTLQELKETQLQLIQTEKMSSLGQMVAGIAHEINNPVSFIKGNVTHLTTYLQELCLIMEKYQQTYEPTPEIKNTIEDIDLEFLLEDTKKILSSINLGTNRVKDIVIALRNFSRLDEAEIKAVDIHDGLESTLLILNHRLKHGINVIKHYGNLPLVECYPAQLNQVFSNLLINAVDAMEEANCNPKIIEIITQTIGDEKIQVIFRDSGPGIKETIKQKIFDPFFTTKAAGKGTGLGLGICYQIIQKHGGSITAISDADKGAEFTITLPTHVECRSGALIG